MGFSNSSLRRKKDSTPSAREKGDNAPPGGTDHVISGPMRGLRKLDNGEAPLITDR